MRLMLHFARSYPRQTWTMLLALTCAGIVEGIGLTALLPMLNLAVGSGEGSMNLGSGDGIGALVTRGLELLGIAPSVGSLLLVILFGIFLKSALVLFADKKVGYTVAHVATDLRLALLRSMLGTRWEYFLSQPVGSLANSAATEVMRASRAYLNGAMAATLLIQALVYAFVALLVSWQATLVAFLAAAGLLVLLNSLVRKTKKAGARQTRLLQSLLARLTDSLHSIKPLKAMGREQVADSLLEADAVKLNRALQKQVYSKAALKSFQEPILMLLVISGLYVALVLWNLDLPTVMVLVFLLARLLNQLGKVQRQYQEMMTCESAFWSLNQKIAEAKIQQEPNPGKEIAAFNDSIRFSGVYFSYGRKQVFTDLNLVIPVGSFSAIVGPSGVGKTTLVDLVIGLLRPQRGGISIDGRSLFDFDLKSWRRLIGYVPQDTILLHDSIFSNIVLGEEDVSEDDVVNALRSAGAWEFVCGMPEGIHSVVGEKGAKISGGQRQRIAIARALVRKPKLLILDEATSALDPESEGAVCRALAGLKGTLTILSISHRPALTELADQVFEIHGGAVEEKRSSERFFREEYSGKA